MRHSFAAEMVREFHEAFGLSLGEVTRRYHKLRADLIREEAKEAADALEFEGLPQIAKELADLVVVAYGTALTVGIDLDRAVALVHASNMSKLGDDGKPVMRDDGKVLKGPNYQPPDMVPALIHMSVTEAGRARGVTPAAAAGVPLQPPGGHP
jgi:predicted HAD superfamily Cof-like phosphohydrolase